MADRIEKEKKRKRGRDGSSRPSKRVAIEGDKQINISLLESDRWAPLIGMYPTNNSPLAIPVLICTSFYSRSHSPFFDFAGAIRQATKKCPQRKEQRNCNQRASSALLRTPEVRLYSTRRGSRRLRYSTEALYRSLRSRNREDGGHGSSKDGTTWRCQSTPSYN